MQYTGRHPILPDDHVGMQGHGSARAAVLLPPLSHTETRCLDPPPRLGQQLTGGVGSSQLKEAHANEAQHHAGCPDRDQEVFVLLLDVDVAGGHLNRPDLSQGCVGFGGGEAGGEWVGGRGAGA